MYRYNALPRLQDYPEDLIFNGKVLFLIDLHLCLSIETRSSQTIEWGEVVQFRGLLIHNI